MRGKRRREGEGRVDIPINLLELALVGDEVVVAESRDIRETSVVLVEISSRGESNSGFEVGRDGSGLVGGSGDVVGETSACGNQGVGNGAHFLHEAM